MNKPELTPEQAIDILEDTASCPACGADIEQLSYVEDLPQIYRHVSVRNGVLVVSTVNTTTEWESGGQNRRLICRECASEFPLRPGLRVQFESLFA